LVVVNPDPGALDQRITIAAEVRTADAYGGAAVTWATLATVWAGVRPLSGRERADAAAIEAPAAYRFTIRRRSDVTEAMRIGWNGAQYNIRFIADPGGRGLYMAIDAERGVAV
jgi:SPP1 family predicted phage head-tail adaptor